ncbi:MAG TPA: hypothetical protein H9832_01585, partial [Candidatus Agathobaculum merdavium]|nr:hypothetical protein [Candidatus Agathobaculum merdavium]
MLLIGKHLQTINRLRQKEKGPIESDRPPRINRKTAQNTALCFIDPFAQTLRVRTLPSSLLPKILYQNLRAKSR